MAGTLDCAIEYSTDLFEPDTIARMAEHLQVLLGSAADAPEALIRELPIMDKAEEYKVEYAHWPAFKSRLFLVFS